MKFTAVLCLILMMNLSLFSANSQERVPFRAIMQSAGAQPEIPQRSGGATGAMPTRTSMTRGGKVEMGIGIGLLSLGVLFIAAGATVKDSDWFASSERAVGFGGGALFAGSGVTLIVLGHRRRSRSDQ